MKQVVLIDGENFIHILLKVLRNTQTDPMERNVLLAFQVRSLLEEALGLNKNTEIIYFGTKLRLNTASASLKDKVEKTRAFQAEWANILANQGIRFVKAGYLRAREGDACAVCGNTEPYLIEKGVDVALAVRIMQEANMQTEILVLSSDTDLLPAMKAAKETAGSLVYVGYERNIILALAAAAIKTRVLTDEAIERFSKKGKKHGK